jgi:hypothetical protein
MTEPNKDRKPQSTPAAKPQPPPERKPGVGGDKETYQTSDPKRPGRGMEKPVEKNPDRDSK